MTYHPRIHPDDERAETTCAHCRRIIIFEHDVWIDPQATGDDEVWRETCDEHDTLTAEHEPEGEASE